ncbi:MAG: hypothetical protein QF921_18620 [Pseudomonadales bacterium]|jgi:hypothetical protein|nr:hypothetical protein [Pseudomonadales bacterium]MDP6472702.1 hypothetical protein [Pseudomonadales bacterium]MDP6827913.1 hypothetical protein [Pseudomonadales bacterium]MDP6973503.1 hypothetical protein [Pseudomonadales bacterium]
MPFTEIVRTLEVDAILEGSVLFREDLDDECVIDDFDIDAGSHEGISSLRQHCPHLGVGFRNRDPGRRHSGDRKVVVVHPVDLIGQIDGLVQLVSVFEIDP